MTTIRMAQYGTKHSHAAGKIRAMLQHPDVELVGVYEPDTDRRQALQDTPPYDQVRWMATKEEMLGDPSIAAIASEGSTAEALDFTAEIVRAGKHVWYDKPAGYDWEQWQRIIALAQESGCYLQMGYMFRYHAGFRRIGEWVRSGLLGQIFAVRAHMSSRFGAEKRRPIQQFAGGILFELGCHVLDQIVWWLGRPTRVSSFLRNDTGIVPAFKDNTLGVFEYDNAMAYIDASANEVGAFAARRIEVYGTRGSALMQPFEPATEIRLLLDEAQSGYLAGEQSIPLPRQTRQDLYNLELAAFLATIQGQQPADRPLTHELVVQETLLRASGVLPAE